MDFYEKAGVVCREIPKGTVASYGQIALLCGKPKNARQVGYALRCGRAGEVPAHRVVNSQGRLSGAASFDMPNRQKRLLESEGVPVCWDENGWRVDLKKYGWKHTMDDALRFRAIFHDQ